MNTAVERRLAIGLPIAAALLAAGGTYAGYLVNPLVPLIAIGALATVVVAFARPMFSLYVSIALIPLDNVYLPIGKAALSPAEAMFALTGFAWAVRRVADGQVPFARSPILKPMLLFFTAMLAGLVVARSDFPITKALVVWSSFSFLTSMLIVDARPADIRRLFIVLAFTGGILGIVGLIGSAGAEAPQLTGLGENAVGRAAGTSGDPNIYATALTFTFPAALALALKGRVALRPFMLGAMALAFAGLALSLSRAGLMGAAAALGVMLFWQPLRRLALVLALFLVGLTLVGANPLLGTTQVKTLSTRISSVKYDSASTGDYRREIWATAFEMIPDYPILGVGEGNFQVVSPSYGLRAPSGFTFDHAHSTPLTIMVELGIFGLIALVWFAGAVIRACWRACRWNVGEDKAVSFAITGALAAFFVHSIVNYMFGSNSIVALLLVFSACAVVMERAAEQRRAEAEVLGGGPLEPSLRAYAT